ncbi:MAG: Mth938-like domain-containing protein [Gammaproteobacteria bacterium]|nr:MAG: Mth938-like domain-containing protein [Gammaproteobacteria bacterium]
MALMPLELDDITDANLIRAYAPGQFTVNLEVITSSIIIMPDQLEANWAPTKISDLDTGHIEIIIDMAPEVVLLGTGKVLQFPEQGILTIFNQHAIGVEVMDTSAACRTYNLLVAEGRNVAAGLLII